MNIDTLEIIARYLKVISEVGPVAFRTLADAEPYAAKLIKTLGGAEPTKEELEDLEKDIDELSEKIQKDIPPEEE